MTDLLKNNPMALRHCILFEVLQGTSIKEAYSKFCKTIGEDFMKYREFDFWYHRFFKGEYDSDFERDKDTKTYELSDMPIDVMEKIVGTLNIFDRVSLAKTSRSLQTFVEDQKLFHHTLGLEVSVCTAGISFSSWRNNEFGERANMKYTRNQTGCVKSFNKREKRVEGVSFYEEALRDFKNILKNPKLYLETLEIELDVRDSRLEPFKSLENAIDVLEHVLKFPHYLNVKDVLLREHSPEQISKILPTLKPGYLEAINIYSKKQHVSSINTQFEMEQWKQAQRFTMVGTCFTWPLHHLYHFKEFHVWLLDFSVKDYCQMKEILFKSPDFEECSLTLFGVNISFVFEQGFGNALRNDPYICHYPIANSADYFEFKVERNFVGHFVKIKRKKS